MAKQDEMTIIAHGVRVEGDFTCSGDMQIEGEVIGTIQSEGDLKVGDKSQIRANVTVKSALVSGEVRGNLDVEGKLELTPSANVIGDVRAEIIIMAAGAKMNGTVTMGENARPQANFEEVEDEE